MERPKDLGVREVQLQLPLTEDAIRPLELGDAVFLSGLLFTGREGVYRQIFDRGLPPPLDIRHACNVTFHCSPAVSEPTPGVYNIAAVTATASFRFAQYVPLLLERYGIRAVIGKGGMQEEVYQTAFRQHGAIYLTTVGYGLGAMYGRQIDGAIQHFCFAHRRMSARIAADNSVTYREDPQWFTPYYRREGIA